VLRKDEGETSLSESFDEIDDLAARMT